MFGVYKYLINLLTAILLVVRNCVKVFKMPAIVAKLHI